MNARRVIEIRSYQLQPGSGAVFHDLVTHQSLPLLAAAGIDVVTHGRSLHDPDAYFLVRAYDSLEHLRSAQAEFYSSAAWRDGPREAIVALIEHDVNAVLWLSVEAIEAMRRSRA
jgi:hypothetical protein